VAFPVARIFLDFRRTGVGRSAGRCYAVRRLPCGPYEADWVPRACGGLKSFYKPGSKTNSHLLSWLNSVELSTAHFARMFRKSTGETPHQFVLRQR